jgi:urease accessory protein UreH
VILESRIAVSQGARLVWLSPATIPCGRAWITQEHHLDLDPRGSVLWLEVWSSGRDARGERWRFREIRTDLTVAVDGTPCYRERWSLGGTRRGHRVPEGKAGLHGMGNPWTAIWRADAAHPTWDPRPALADHIRALGGVAEWADLGSGCWILKGLSPYGRTELPPIGQLAPRA